jgi:acyl phosphate:glycerol-3-phosphate acyltransferase
MSTLALACILIACSFLLGSIPCSYLIGKAKGVDIRTLGSKNIGASNLGRVLGRKYFFLGFALDMLKGLLPVLVAGWMLGTLGRYASMPGVTLAWLACAVAAVLGHVFTPWLSFKGGKGIATGFGVLLGLFPVMTIVGACALASFLVVLWRWRYISLGSLASGVTLPIALVLLLAIRSEDAVAALTRDSGPLYLTFALVLCGLVFWTHWSNITRLRAGTESKIGARVTHTPGGSAVPAGSKP